MTKALKNSLLFAGSNMFFTAIALNEAFFAIWGWKPVAIGTAGTLLGLMYLVIKCVPEEGNVWEKWAYVTEKMHVILFWAATILAMVGTVCVELGIVPGMAG